MERALGSAVLALALLAAGCSQSLPPVAGAERPERSDRPPTWLPEYSAEQKALLAPVSHPIQVPVARVLPDLTRFLYGADHPLANVEQSFRLTKMFATILTDSPRFYSLVEGPPDVANPRVQYGPPPEKPDGMRVAVRGSRGVSELRPAALHPEARTELAEGQRLAEAKQPAQAASTFRTAVARSPNVPALRLALVEALRAAGQGGEAETALKEAIAVDATFAPFHLALSELAEQRGDIRAAKKALAEALAYDPSSKRALDAAARFGDAQSRIKPIPIFLDVDVVGAVHIATSPDSAAQMYGGCRAVMRYEPDVRAAMFDQPKDLPYHLSMVEEIVCIEAALGAYLFDRKTQPDATKPNASLDSLLAVASSEGLSGYVMFEILGQHRPERARLAPPDVHKAMVIYVERHLLGDVKMPEGVYTASR